MKYDPSKIEPKWIKRWEEQGLYKAVDFDEKPKKYILVEFPYPSGERLHVGHARTYCALDALARYHRMNGYNVLFPFGWDAFGLPAENYAIKTGINPQVTTAKNIANSKAQVRRWGLSFDWDREVNTTDPFYYRWTQWIFLKLLEKEMAYQAEVPVNWCPKCKSNLADEEVLADGTHERCGQPTERRMQKQWILRITKYADRLLDDLNLVDYLPKIRIQQENWIGRSEGIKIEFPLDAGNWKLETGKEARGSASAKASADAKALADKSVDESKLDKDASIKVFTTRPDTIFGVTFFVLAPEHELVEQLTTPDNKEKVESYIAAAKNKSELERISEMKEKTGVFTGSYVVNPLSGGKIPVYVADFVLISYGTGAVMGVPGHDQRDWDFAKQHGLEIKEVISGGNVSEKAYTGEGKLVNSGKYDGLAAKEAIDRITKDLEKQGLGEKSVSYHLRDWVFSRQHYWGEPIPVIHCEKCGVVPVPEEDLPVELPYVENYQPSGTGESPLANVSEWVNTTCPRCGGPAKRETDTMPNWAGSNWYFLRYCDSENDKEFADLEKLKYWMPVDLYNGGMEHTTLHLLYSRFIHKFLYDCGFVPVPEPYAKRTSHGVVLGPDGQKMSKSLGNVINPDDVVEAFGADTFRLYEAFMGPFGQMIAWDPKSVEGCSRFLKRAWRLVGDPAEGLEQGRRVGDLERSREVEESSPALQKHLHRLVKKVGGDLEAMKFNTAVAAFMEFVNKWSKAGQNLSKDDIKIFLRTLAPFAPFICEEMWANLGEETSIHLQKWPKYDKSLLKEDTVTMVVQINGKVRGKIDVPTETSADEVKNRVGEMGNVKRYLEGKKIKKTIFVEGKLINFVI